jgi:hypothetical protein
LNGAQLSPGARLETTMKQSFLPHHINTLAVAAFAALGLMLSSGAAFAQTTKTIKGNFHSNDGNNGSFVETIATDGDSKTDTLVYTRRSDKATSTDIFTTVTNPTNDSYTVAYSHTDYGSTAEFTSNKTVDKVKGGYFGSGTYTTATGITGTLRSLETKASDVGVTSTAYLPSTGTAGTNDLRVEEDALGFKVVRTLSVDSNGTTTSVITTRTFRD